MATIKLRKPTEEEKDKIKDAAEKGELRTLQQLTTNGVDITGIVFDLYNMTALHLAALGGHYNVLTFLCSQGDIVDNVDNDQWTPLHWAALRGHTDCVALLAKSGANVNRIDVLQCTPLHWAAQQGHTDCVALLIMSRANINIKDEWGDTPLQLAVINGHHKTVEYFIQQAKMDITQFDMQESIDDGTVNKSAKDVTEYEKKISAKEVEINQLNDRVTELTIKQKELKIENQMLKRNTEKLRVSLKEYQDKKLETKTEKLKTEIEELWTTSKFEDAADSNDVSISNEILKHGSYYVTAEAQYCGKQCIAKMKHLNKNNSSMLLNKERTFLLLLKHDPFIVQLFATYGNPQSPVLLMERMWMSLTEFLTNKELHHNKINILRDAACGLHYIHEKGIIHCDLSTDNIMLTESITAKLADFGHANCYQQTIKYLTESLDHLPPEMMCKPYSGTSFSTKVDVFSFGCVIIHTFTQEFPMPDFDKYIGTSEVGKYIKHSEVERRSICLKKFKNNSKSIELYDIVLKCLQDNPDNRPTAATLLSLLEKQMTTNVPNFFKYVEDICPQMSFKSERCRSSITTLLVEQLRLLTTLNVSGCNITDQGADIIAAVLLENVSLAKLDFSNTGLNSVKATKVVSALKNISSLKAFNINNNDIDDGAAGSIAVAVSSNSLLEKVNLSHNRLSYTGMLNIVKALPENIRAVDISNNLIASDNIGDLTIALSKWHVLQEFNISQNLLSLTNVLTIAEVFRNHPTLETLDLSSNNISFSSACEFIVDVVLSVNQKLVTLNVCSRNIRPRFVEDYLSPPNSKNDSNKFVLQSLHLLQHSSLQINNTQMNFIKVTETCPIYDDNIMSYYVDYLGGVFYNQYHNFAIVISPGAVAQGDCVEIQGTANYFGPYIIPDGFYPISSHYWVSANYEFKAPVYFIMNHYAKIRCIDDINNLHVLHKCTHEHHTTNNDIKMSMISGGVYFDNEIGYCVLATDHFCTYCEAKTDKLIPEYLTACYCTYDESSIGTHIAEVCFCPSNYNCKKLIEEQCKRRNTKIKHTVTFDITDGEELHISSIDLSSVNNHEWRLFKTGKPNIVHLRDFAFWKIFYGLTVEEIRQREESFDYPPRLQIECEQIDDSKPLYSSFAISKKHTNVIVAEFSLIKKVVVPVQTAMQQDKQDLNVLLPATSRHRIFLLSKLLTTSRY